MKPDHDPFLMEIIQQAAQAACDEMLVIMCRTAMSPVIYESKDVGLGITAANGDLVCVGAGMPSFTGVLQVSVQSVIAKYGAEGIRPGDMFITNDPYGGGGTHLNDVVILKPVFAGAHLYAWLVNKGHWSDLGGMVSGGVADAATEIYQEGLQLCEIRLFDRGERVQSVIDIIAANSRIPQYTLGDMWAGVAAAAAGERELDELVAHYGVEAVEQAFAGIIEYGEAVSRDAMASLPKGTFFTTDQRDDGAALRCEITITDSEFIVDLRGNPKSESVPYNTPYISTLVRAQHIFKAITSPHTVANAGSFRPLKVLTDPGSIFHVIRPTPVGLFFEAGFLATELIWKTIAAQVPTRVSAGSFSSLNGMITVGTHPESQRTRVMLSSEAGGWGASAEADGQNGLKNFGSGENRLIPVEIIEARFGVLVDRYEYHNWDGGEGKYRGGRGTCVDYRVRAEDFVLVKETYIHANHPTWGLGGGSDGSVNYCEIRRRDGSVEKRYKNGKQALQPGDVIRFYSAHGGGHGDPAERSRQAVLDDLADEYITAEQAARFYGMETRS